jgi:hypothetical protein
MLNHSRIPTNESERGQLADTVASAPFAIEAAIARRIPSPETQEIALNHGTVDAHVIPGACAHVFPQVVGPW